MGTWVLSPGVKQPGHDDDHSPPSSTKVKNEKHYTSTPHICLHSIEKANFMDFFTFTFNFSRYQRAKALKMFLKL
jgi:hypothetical protein